MSHQLSTNCLSQSSDHNPALKLLFPPLNFSDPLAMAPNHREMSAVASEGLNYHLIDTFFSFPPPFLPISRSCRIHSRLPPLKGKPSKKMSLYSQFRLIQLWINNFFFLGGKKISHSSRIQRKLLQFGHVQHKSHSEAFFAAIVGIGAAAGEKEKRKKERDSPGEGGKTFLPLELLKPTSSPHAPKIPQGTQPANQGEERP